MQEGGELLGQGVYGCAFNPPLECKRNQSSSMNVGKVTSINEAYGEYSISLNLEALPYSEEYFVLIKDICVPKPRKNQKDKTISKCKTLNNTRLPSRIQLLMPFGGTPLMLSNMRDINEIGKTILEAGTLLLLGGIVHADIHANNILMDSMGSVRIIDFGKAWSLITLNKNNIPRYEFNPKPSACPPEENIISAIDYNFDLDLSMARLADEKVILSLIYKISGKTIESQLNDLKKFMKSSQVFRERNWLSFYKIYWKKIDAWGIGCVLMNLYIINLMNSNIPEMRNKIMQKCILGLTDLDPGKRLDSLEALELWAPDSKILNIPEIQLMLQEQKETRNRLMNKIGVF
jgi:serine/threonine protein kinase